MGNMMGSLEAWLLIRSLRTFHLRLLHQSTTATALVQWLNSVAASPENGSVDGVPGGVLKKVLHSSIQVVDPRGFHPSKQMEGGWGPTFSILVNIFIPSFVVNIIQLCIPQLSSPEHAKALPFLTKYFTVHCPSFS